MGPAEEKNTFLRIHHAFDVVSREHIKSQDLAEQIGMLNRTAFGHLTQSVLWKMKGAPRARASSHEENRSKCSRVFLKAWYSFRIAGGFSDGGALEILGPNP